MSSKVSTKRKVMAGSLITKGTLVTTAGVTVACAAAPMTGAASLLPIAGGTTLVVTGMATTTNLRRKELKIH